MLFFLSRRKNRGSFLIEIIAAVVVLSIGLLTVMQVYASQRRIATLNYQQTREELLLADHLAAVSSGVDVDALYRQEEALGKDIVLVEEKELTDDKKGLIEKALLVQKQSGRKQGRMIVTYVKGDDATASF